MHFKIHRGTKEIGGSCVEVWTDTSRVILDLGMPLVNPDGSEFDSSVYAKYDQNSLIEKKLLPDIEGLYSANIETHIILSHAHLDHYGLMRFVGPKCKFHLGQGTHSLISITQKYNGKDGFIHDYEYFTNEKAFNIGDIKITPYLMDHSAFDSYAFRIESGGKSIFYTSDFRSHGRKSASFNRFCDTYTLDTDYLIIEGTTLGRTDHTNVSESDLEKQLLNIFSKTQGLAMIYTASQNIDRIVSIFRATLKSDRTLVMDNYTAAVMTAVNANGTLPVPSDNNDRIKVFFGADVKRVKSEEDKKRFLSNLSKYKIQSIEINAEPNKYVLLVRPSMLNHLKKFDLSGASLTYSLWSGYKNTNHTKRFLDFLTAQGVAMHIAHTSGHADKQALKLMVSAIAPKYIVPIHTLSANEYKSTFTAYTVHLVDDGEDVEVK